MNLRKLFMKELQTGLTFVAIVATRFFVIWKPIQIVPDIVGVFSGIWAAYYLLFYNYKKVYKIDEREENLLIQSLALSPFILMTLLLSLFLLENLQFPPGIQLKSGWILTILPLFLLSHSTIGLALTFWEEK